MLLTAATDIPIGEEWLYECKYDGFRGELDWGNEPILKSRNGNILNHKFPEIIKFCSEIQEQIKTFLPLKLDGEIVYLINNFQSNFNTVQKRGRMQNKEVINHHLKNFSCHYVVFDLLMVEGKSVTNKDFVKRKLLLHKLFKELHLPISVNYENINRIQAIDVFQDSQLLWHRIKVGNGEGLVAKRKKSNWKGNTRSVNWLKIKNWRYVSVILTKYDKKNGFFHGSIINNELLTEVVTFRHGLKVDELKVLVTLFLSNGTNTSDSIWELEPSICIEIACIDFVNGALREPRFHAFNFEKDIEECDWQHMQRQLYPLPDNIVITHPEKPIWASTNIQKNDYILYLQHVAPYMLPFLRNRLLTVIRYPHGVPGESFYQKNTPEYIPGFVTTKQIRGKNYIICNDLESLLWLGNQLAIEFHIPFNTINTNKPTEIVFDLDPPSLNEFSIAREAALRLETIFNQLGLQSFPKTSGGKGIHVYIPLPFDMFTYADTRIFSEFICKFLCEQEPQWFTTERLKKNRNNRLYLDFIQHKAGNTLAAPYSPRGNEKGLISTPLNWDEVNDSLTPTMFTIPAVIERILQQGNPFHSFIRTDNEQPFVDILSQLKKE
ncbi:DNA ligase D [Viridibacillus arvi]|uniref:DNA ligase D n=1 Tax=Viridibacillus arvi TaxID=263475 RepID=UPI0034CDBC50